MAAYSSLSEVPVWMGEMRKDHHRVREMYFEDYTVVSKETY